MTLAWRKSLFLPVDFYLLLIGAQIIALYYSPQILNVSGTSCRHWGVSSAPDI